MTPKVADFDAYLLSLLRRFAYFFSFRIRFDVAELAIALQTVITAIQQLFHLQITHLAICIDQSAFQKRCHLLVIAVRTTDRFVDDFVNDAKCFESVRGDAQRIGCVLRFVRRFPQN